MQIATAIHRDPPTPASREAVLGLLTRGWTGAQRTAVHRAFSSVLGAEYARTHFDMAEELNQAITSNDRLRPALQARDHQALARVYTIAANAADRIQRALISKQQPPRTQVQGVLVVTSSSQRSPRPKPVFQPTNRPVIVLSRGWSLHPTD